MITLLRKEFTLELRRKSVLAGLLLYLVSTVFICYLSFSIRQTPVDAPAWSALLWIVVLFSIVNTSAKGFVGEKAGLDIYLYSVANPGHIILSKIIYNFLLAVILAVIAFGSFLVFFESPIEDLIVFLSALVLGSGALSSSLTIISSIAAKANNSNVLVAVLGFPVVVSIILPVVKITRNAIDGLDWSASQPELVMLLAINCLIAAVSFLLFPYIWRS